MTDALKMEPSAEERARKLLAQPSLVIPTDVAADLEQAFRDGAKAERDRILKILREPSDELWHKLMYEFGQQANRNDGIERILEILADALREADPT